MYITNTLIKFIVKLQYSKYLQKYISLNLKKMLKSNFYSNN